MSDYWTECIEASFEEAGIKATKEQIELVAGDVEVSSENYGMAHGHDAIPNPRDADVDRVTKRLEQMKQELDQAVFCYKKNVASRHRCNVEDVSIDEHGIATIHR